METSTDEMEQAGAETVRGEARRRAEAQPEKHTAQRSAETETETKTETKKRAKNDERERQHKATGRGGELEERGDEADVALVHPHLPLQPLSFVFRVGLW